MAGSYAAGVTLRERCYNLGIFKTRHLNIPVISVGNLTVGGTGKTPFVVALAGRLSENLKVAVVSRGYRRESSQEPLLVSDGERTLVSARESGDEPYLIARSLPGVGVAVGKDRYRAAELVAKKVGAQVVILDDGFQNRSIKKDLELLLVDGQKGFGNNRLLPAGPLREPVEAAKRAHLVVLVKKGKRPVEEEVAERVGQIATGIPVETVDMELSQLAKVDGSEGCDPESMRGKKAIAFCGIGNPQGFFRMLQEAGIELARQLVFPDHHRYTHEEVARLAEVSKGMGHIPMITTAKDEINLPPPPHPQNLWIAKLSVKEVPSTVLSAVEHLIQPGP